MSTFISWRSSASSSFARMVIEAPGDAPIAHRGVEDQYAIFAVRYLGGGCHRITRSWRGLCRSFRVRGPLDARPAGYAAVHKTRPGASKKPPKEKAAPKAFWRMDETWSLYPAALAYVKVREVNGGESGGGAALTIRRRRLPRSAQARLRLVRRHRADRRAPPCGGQRDTIRSPPPRRSRRSHQDGSPIADFTDWPSSATIAVWESTDGQPACSARNSHG